MSSITIHTPPPWRDPLLPQLIVGLLGVATFLHVCGWLSIALSVPGWWAFLICSDVLYPTYLLYVVKPYTTPSVKRTIAIVAPAVALAVIARPLRVTEKWGMQSTHLILGTVGLSIKKGLEFAINRIEPSIVTQWHRFIIHYMIPADVAFEDDPERRFQQLLNKELSLDHRVSQPSTPVQMPTCSSSQPHVSNRRKHAAPNQPWHNFRLPSDDNETLTAEEYKSRFLNVRQRGLNSVLTGFWWFGVGMIPASSYLLMHYHSISWLHMRVLNHEIIVDTVGGLLVAMVCCGMFSFVEGTFSILYGDGLYIGPMFTAIFAATSLSDFWYRWNRGMRDVFYYAIYKQLGGRKHVLLASAAVGICSGLVHEYQVFLYVGPYTHFNMMTFFVIQAVGVALERLWTKCSPVHIPVLPSRLMLYAWFIFTSNYFIADSGLSAKILSELVVSFWSSLFCTLGIKQSVCSSQR